MLFGISIESETGSKIVFDTEEKFELIKGVSIFVDTIDDDVRDKSDALSTKVIIKGAIVGESMERVKEIFEWSLDTNQNTCYRTVEVDVFDNKVRLRHYVLKKMFVVDYKEIYDTDGNKNEKSYFELYLTQKKGFLDTIDTYI